MNRNGGSSFLISSIPGAGAVSYSSLASGIIPLEYASVTLTNAQVLALNTTPVTLASAISGVFLFPVGFGYVKQGGAAYTINGGALMQLNVGSTSWLTLTGVAVLDQSGSKYNNRTGFFSWTSNVNGAGSGTGLVGQALTVNASTGSFSGSDSSGTVRVYVIYYRIPDFTV